MKNYDNVIDLLITLVVEEIAEDENREPSEVLAEFISSKTAKKLYKENTKFWWDGSSYIAYEYQKEKLANKFGT